MELVREGGEAGVLLSVLTNGCCPAGSEHCQGPSAGLGTAVDEPGSRSIQGVQSGAKKGEDRDRAGEKAVAWV